MTGWEPNFLQQAINTCTSDTGLIGACPLFNVVSEDEARSCHMPIPSILANEAISGPLAQLPGNVQITFANGPAPAPAPAAPAAPEASPDPPAPAANPAANPDLPYAAGSIPSNSASPGVGDVFKESSTAAPPAPSVPAPAPPAPSPETTPAPSAVPAAADIGKSFYSTEYITAGDIVSEILWVEETVYVTQYEDVTSTTVVAPTPIKKRHGHVDHADVDAAHLRRHVHHHHRY